MIASASLSHWEHTLWTCCCCCCC